MQVFAATGVMLRTDTSPCGRLLARHEGQNAESWLCLFLRLVVECVGWKSANGCKLGLRQVGTLTAAATLILARLCHFLIVPEWPRVFFHCLLSCTYFPWARSFPARIMGLCSSAPTVDRVRSSTLGPKVGSSPPAGKHLRPSFPTASAACHATSCPMSCLRTATCTWALGTWATLLHQTT